jgi:hypothetical protein
MRFLRLAAAAAVPFALVSGAAAATRTSSTAVAAPQDVHGFLLRADEAPADTFTRTPSFGWKPVRGASRYQFELSSTRAFASGAVLWSSKTLTTPAVSLPMSLPWMSGTPYSLYARVRGIAPDGTAGTWSTPFGFNIRWPAVPTPMSAPAGLLRWTAVDGATSYDVWLLDPNKVISTPSNVADEREYYTFHQGRSWSGAVHWRVRAVRARYGLAGGRARNGLPIVSYGPWSPTYTATNPTFATGSLKPTQAISDTASTAARQSAHRLMPAFAFTGDTSLAGRTAELYRVYVATDKDCVNVVFRGAVVGGPAYAPRLTGPLALPQGVGAVDEARAAFLPDGQQGKTFTADNLQEEPNESLPPDTTPITSGEDDSPTIDTAVGAGGAAQAGGAPGAATLSTDGLTLGPPIDLWDTDWPTGRYYWTVVPVVWVKGAPFTAALAQGASDGAAAVTIANASQLAVGDQLQIGTGANMETVSVVEVHGASVAIAPALKLAHGAGEKVVRVGSELEYRDLEVPQDACQSGRVLTFGKTSEPAVTRENGQTPFASGLSPGGTLRSAQTPKPAFYGSPLVSWQPALGAGAYEVQWSKVRYPFRPAATPLLTFGTSATLQLSPRTWWYRVRGLNLGLPAGARAMGWSDPAALVVTKPKFAVVPTKR